MALLAVGFALIVIGDTIIGDIVESFGESMLGEILEEQQKLMLDNVDITIKAAQAEYDKNKNQAVVPIK